MPVFDESIGRNGEKITALTKDVRLKRGQSRVEAWVEFTRKKTISLEDSMLW